MSYGVKLDPQPIASGLTIRELVDHHLYAYNAARLREACQLFAQKIAQPEVTIGITLSGALTPTGLGTAAIVPLIRAGLIDWVVSTGANLYHDIHRTLGFDLWGTTPFANDRELREKKLIRIYDILFEQDVLFKSDQFLYQCMRGPEFQHTMGTAELHYLLGRYTKAREKATQIDYVSILTAAHEAGVPLYTSSPGDSTIGMNVAALAMMGNKLRFDVERDVNETTAIVHDAKQSPEGKSAVIVLGGGSPKNFILQTEPQLQEIMGISEKGHDYYIQFTDARPDTGGLSGATPSEAMTWGKIDPDQLPDTIVCYCDSTIALPIMAAYVLDVAGSRPLKRLYDRRDEMMDTLQQSYNEALKSHNTADHFADSTDSTE
ncbi:MAG: deoxyhypusine synthase [Chloroflexi bacterium AL-W]|nr:deoxyhypusine synthase [Chloroflexi bacterium AL-N1]NOK69135.1 deoxyhypusine synthase [Chloroflexi bacterium AL-N10]NOK77118.1 deoxyhypusine synthase [Chloroflexi bacterium AL-N5]NOK83763.1 deoxyhypusine synthase [Chloroflexi bacterium AL-W]NOK90973.1 deoxyhypusine synthase [Chloroflexi bacterium AL-N15]